MKQGLMLLLAVCTLAAAMVPGDRRAGEERLKTSTSISPETCAKTTPCQWDVYKLHGGVKVKEMTIENTYCECSKEQQCTYGEDHESSGAFIYYCRNRKGQKSNDN